MRTVHAKGDVTGVFGHSGAANQYKTRHRERYYVAIVAYAFSGWGAAAGNVTNTE